MNKLGIFMNFWEKNWDADHAKYIKKVKKLGFDILEFQAQPLLDMSDEKIRNLKKLADEEGIELTYSLGLDPNYDVSSLDEGVRQGGVKYLQDIIRKMKIGGGTLLSGVSYAGWGTPNVIMDSKEAYLEQSVKSMREIVKVAEECNVTYCVEAVNRFETCLINTAKEAVEYCDMIDSPNIGVLLDTYHMNIEEDSMTEAILLAGDRLGHFHVGENNRRLPGKGNLPWYQIGSALRAIGYDKNVVMEPFVKSGGKVGSDIKIWRDLSMGAATEQLDRDAAASVAFLRNVFSGPNSDYKSVLR